MPENIKIDSCGDIDLVPVKQLEKNDRIENLKILFAANFKQEPDFYVRVPGRVNLIGEHIDYCGYGVLPMALEQDILIAVGRRSDHQINMVNQDPAYENYSCDIRNIKIDMSDGEGPKWYKYFLCGVKGVLETMPNIEEASGMNVAVTGNVPQSAGLSSSSALVSASALTTAQINKIRLPKQKIATLCAECEKYIGTQGGGMDQAIAFLATQGCAKFIEFCPLRSKDVVLPQNATFVIAHSLVRLNKAATADFNCRVVECRLATQILAKKNGLNWEKLLKLGDLQSALKVDLPSMVKMVKENLHPEIYSKEEVCEILEILPDELEKLSLTPNTKNIKQFKIYQRALHVFQEAQRVQEFYTTCSKSASLKCLGSLMSASHFSLRDLYECSHNQLDQLVDLCHNSGALGARLTGAGWGGCVVALIEQGQEKHFVETLKEKFYKPLGVENDFENLIFVTSPMEGASVHYFNDIENCDP